MTPPACPSPADIAAWDKSGFFPRHKARLNGPLVWPNSRLVVAAEGALVDGGSLALIGARGTGKTQLAAWLSWRVLRLEGRHPSYMRTQDYFASIKRSFDGDENDPRRKARAAGLLVLDEVQERFESAFEDLELASLLDHRYGHMRPTVLIANLKADALAESLGASIVSRIQETGIVVPCEWPSFRQRGAQ